MKKTKKLVSILLIFIMAASVFCINSYAADNGIKVKFKVGSTSVQIDGTYKSFEKSYISNGTVMASSDILVKALGAELNNNGKGNYNIVYRNESIDMTAGSKKCDINQTEGTLPAAPAVKGTSLMVPFKYTAEKLGATVRYDSSTGTLTADWADDGALTDLSFLTDSIKKTRVGDSFYGWNMNIPRGSRVAYSSFNSRHISIENTNRSVYFDIYIDKPGKDITNIEDYYNQVMDSPEDYLNGSVPDDSNLVTTGTVPYAEFRYTGSSGEPIIQRSYMNSGSIYSVMLSYYSDNGTDDISDSPYYKAILDSFSFGYKGTNIDVQDLSKITYGMAEYSNYSTFENGNKYYSWQVSVPSDWDYIKSPAESPLSTKLGTGSDQYINIEIEKPIGSNNVETIGSSLKNLYNSNYSPSLYKFEQGEVTSTAAGKAYHMLYDLSLGGTFYSYDEYLLVSGGLLYDLTLKCPQTSYQQKKDENKKILSSFKPADKVSAAYSKDIDSYQNQTNRNRVGKYDGMTVFDSKQYKWSVKVPGNWIKSLSSDGSYVSFFENELGLSIGVEAVENNSDNKTAADDEKFSFMGAIENNDGVELKNQTTVTDKGKTINIYDYRWEDSAEEIFADVQFKVIDGKDYSYCYFSIMPDELKCSANVSLISDIWNSFTLED